MTSSRSGLRHLKRLALLISKDLDMNDLAGEHQTVSMAPIDLNHLGSQTMDDVWLQAELLDMFVEQMNVSTREFSQGDSTAALAALHRLKGAALAVGAFAVAAAVDRVEQGQDDAQSRAALQKSLEEAKAFIIRHAG